MDSHNKTSVSTSVRSLLLAHGAGAGMDSSFMERVAANLDELNVEVERFNFPYMEKQKETGKKRPPDRMPILIQAYREQITQQRQADRLFIGGKSMGARVATLVASQQPFMGVVCLGFPFHAPGKPIGDRIQHFAAINSPVLILQGERDPFGNREEIAALSLPTSIEICWLEDANHDLRPRQKSGFDHAQHLLRAAHKIREFMEINSAK